MFIYQYNSFNRKSQTFKVSRYRSPIPGILNLRSMKSGNCTYKHEIFFFLLLFVYQSFKGVLWPCKGQKNRFMDQLLHFLHGMPISTG